MSILVRRLRLAWLLRFLLFAFLAGLVAVGCFIGYLAIARRSPLQLPAPTGPYPVGRLLYDWRDASRDDPLAAQPAAARELAVWVWYPAAGAGVSPAPYLPPIWVKARDQDQGLGYLIEYDFNRIQAHSFENVPLAADQPVFPVLVMEPGMDRSPTDYTVLAENLASHGYIVVGINPTDTSNLIVFPDGRLAPRTLQGTIPDSDTLAAVDADAERIGAVWVADVLFVLDQLQGLNASPSSFFFHRLDLEHIGFWGHSFGGATALAVCQQDPRCKAGVDMDGTPVNSELAARVPQPFLFITEDYSQGCDSNCELVRQVYLDAEPEAAYLLSIAGARHFNFSDLPLRQVPLVRPLFHAAGYIGSIDPARALQITNAYLVAFFDHYLKGIPADLLQRPATSYPEVQFEKR